MWAEPRTLVTVSQSFRHDTPKEIRTSISRLLHQGYLSKPDPVDVVMTEIICVGKDEQMTGKPMATILILS